jgi:condensin complex subunit 1
MKKQKKKEERKAGDEDHEEELDLIAGGGDADLEADKSFLENVLHKTLLQKNLLSKFVPIIDKIVQNIFEKYNKGEEKNATYLERVTILSFCKFMLVSPEYCQSRIDRMFDLLSLKGFDSKVKSNLLICIGDLYKRFPTILDNYHQKFFLNLSSDNSYVRRHCLRVISHLALNDMIKIRGEISDICKLLKDEDSKIQDLVKLFLHELHSKHNETIYNLIPEAINRLSE